MVVFAAGDGSWRRVDEIYEPVRIGEGMGAVHELGKAPMTRALNTLDVFAHFAHASGLDADAVDAVATSAIRGRHQRRRVPRARAAPDRPAHPRDSHARRRLATGTIAAVNSTTLADGVVLDLGGGRCSSCRSLVVMRRSWRRGASAPCA